MRMDPLWLLLVFLLFWVIVAWLEADLAETRARRAKREGCLPDAEAE